MIINASSGADSSREVQQCLAEAFKAIGADAQISLAGNGVELVKLAQSAARSDAERVVAGGGDGTINSVGFDL